MSVDPRLMKQLLQLQMQSKLDLFSSVGKSVSDTEGVDFASLLSQVMGQAESGIEQPATSPMPKKAFVAPMPYSKPTTFEPLIAQAGHQYGVETSLIKAVIQAESSFNAHAVSHAGAKGLMQLMDKTGQALGVTDPFDPEQNIRGGTQFLSDLLRKYDGNEAVALAAYNAGPGRVDRLGIRTDADLRQKLDQLPQETQHYVKRVLQYKNSYEGV